jgi:hypothetical protein
VAGIRTFALLGLLGGGRRAPGCGAALAAVAAALLVPSLIALF